MFKNKKIFFIVNILLIVFILSMFFVFNGYAVTKIVRSQAEEQLDEVTKKTAANLGGMKEQSVNDIESIAYFYKDYYDKTSVEKLTEIKDSSFFDFVSFTDLNGKTISCDGNTYDDNKYSFYTDGMAGKCGYCVCEFPNSGINLIFYAPVIKDNNVVGIMVGYHDYIFYQKLLEHEFYGKSTKSFLVYSKDGIIIGSNQEYDDYITLKEYFVGNGFLKESEAYLIDECFSGVEDGFSYKGNVGSSRCDIEKLTTSDDLYIVETFPSETFVMLVHRYENIFRYEIAAFILLICINISLLIIKYRKNKNEILNERLRITSVLDGTQKLFVLSSYVDLKSDCYKIIDYSSNYNKVFPKTGSFEESKKYFSNLFVSANRNKPLANCINKEYVLYQFKNSDTVKVTIEYTDQNNHWYTLNIIKLDNIGQNNERFLFVINDINDVKNEQDKIRKISQMVYGTYDIFTSVLDINNGTIKITDIIKDLPDLINQTLKYEDFISIICSKIVIDSDKEAYKKLACLETVIKNLNEHNLYDPRVNMFIREKETAMIEGHYRYIDKGKGLVLCTASDVTAKIDHDFITGYLSEDGFRRFLYEELINNRVNNYYLLNFNISHFKLINEQFGSSKGDEVLKECADYFMNSKLNIKALARTNNDDFYLYIPGTELDLNLINSLCEVDFKSIGQKFYLTCGILKCDSNIEKIKTLMEKSKFAQKEAKKNLTGKSYFIYNDELRYIYDAQFTILQELDVAIKNNEIKAYYQPIFDCKTKKVVSCEALARWERDGKLISPGIFIPPLELSGKISILDLKIEEIVENFLTSRINDNLKVVPISVNLSRADLLNFEILKTLLNRINNFKINNDYLRFEITESAYLNIPLEQKKLLDEIKAKGHKLLIDDFGTGYSSFGSLIEADYAILKIDMSFIRKIGNKKNDEAIKSIILFAHEIGMKVVSEGVETEEQYKFLLDNNCDYIQGYYFSKPLTEKDFINLLTNN